MQNIGTQNVFSTLFCFSLLTFSPASPPDLPWKGVRELQQRPVVNLQQNSPQFLLGNCNKNLQSNRALVFYQHERRKKFVRIIWFKWKLCPRWNQFIFEQQILEIQSSRKGKMSSYFSLCKELSILLWHECHKIQHFLQLTFPFSTGKEKN